MTSKADPLIIFALEMESLGLFDGHRLVHTGVGKVQATHALTKTIIEEKPQHVINLGSAGSAVHKAGSVVCCTGFVQRDMDVTPLGIDSFVTPFSDHPAVLKYGNAVADMPECICGSGDNFDTSHSQGVYDVVDMEAFALAWICHKENIPFTCIKYISDGADGAAADNWKQALEDGAHKLRGALNKYLEAA